MSEQSLPVPNRNLMEFVEASADNSYKINEIADTPVTINSVEFTETGKGKYGLMNVTTQDNRNLCVVNTSQIICLALARANDLKAFPVTATFTKKGQRWILA
jgi:hypothetical protein